MKHQIPDLNATPVPSLPGARDGQLFQSVGKYARGAVLYAFERIGGADSLADWAQDNQDDFYTKLFPKIITREVEVDDRRGVDELLNVLDGEYEVMPDSSAPAAPPAPPAPSAPAAPSPAPFAAAGGPRPVSPPSGADTFDVDDLTDFDDG